MTGGRLPLRRLVAELGNALGQPDDAVLGVPVALDLRWRRDEHGIFVSGLPADVVERVCAAFGTVGHGAPDVAPEWWSVSHGRGIGTGPVLIDRGDGAPSQLAIRKPEPVDVTKLEQANELRTQLAKTATALETSLDDPLDAGALLAAIAYEPDAARDVLTDVAASRSLVGRYLLDAADELDDERVDQLGDGYVRASHLWAALPARPDPDLVRELLVLERSCMEWMRSAADPPTRYAF